MPIKVFIDQGHNPTGFHDTGAEAFGLTAQEVNFEVGICLATLLNNDPRFEARLSRPTPETVIGTDSVSSVEERVAMANEWPADYLISIQCNYNFDPEVNGTEVYVFRNFTSSSWLAQNVVREISDVVETKNNGVFVNPYIYLLRYARMPAIMVYLAYITNQLDAQKLRDEPTKFASGIYVGLLRFLGYA
ncbi:MAG: cell wall hydrolase [Firmicutes bacterium HGW-Firmicutes-21]|nr:MAG: cell wall hydrolase [Firmicutes bacterium HGW-Firmicutes-21]